MRCSRCKKRGEPTRPVRQNRELGWLPHQICLWCATQITRECATFPDTAYPGGLLMEDLRQAVKELR